MSHCELQTVMYTLKFGHNRKRIAMFEYAIIKPWQTEKFIYKVPMNYFGVFLFLVCQIKAKICHYKTLENREGLQMEGTN
jgi:hypothetical protein